MLLTNLLPLGVDPFQKHYENTPIQIYRKRHYENTPIQIYRKRHYENTPIQI